MTITERAKEIMKEWEGFYNDTPTSLSGKHHHGETHAIHAEETANAMRHLCLEFNIPEVDRDLLIAASYLHDIGLAVITRSGKMTGTGWKYFEVTDFSRLEEYFDVHAKLSGAVIHTYKIERKEELMRLVSVHMSHWHPKCPQPENLYEYLICMADYIVTYGTMKKFEERFQ